MQLALDGASIGVSDLVAVVARILAGCGVAEDDALVTASDLVAADLEDIASHGVMLVPMYVERLRAGSVSLRSRGEIVVDNDGCAVIDAQHALGQLVAGQAVEEAVDRARRFGAGVVAVRNAFHFGAAGRWARLMASQDCIGIVSSNTRPLMPAPGGAEPVTGNNPLAIVVPSFDQFQPEVDMALSASAMGKIRIAAAEGRTIPEGWAADADGAPTIDPQRAIEGMLLPAAGAKGFGLAFVLDLLCGGLSAGAIGREVRPLYGRPEEPYRSSQLFIAIHVGHFLPIEDFAVRMADVTRIVSRSKTAPGVSRLFAPGELAHAARVRNNDRVKLSASTIQGLLRAADMAGVSVHEFAN